MKRDTQYGDREAIAEGFPELTGAEFVSMFCENMRCPVEEEITRIEFRYVPGGAFLPAEPWQLSTVDEDGNLKPSIPLDSLITAALWSRGAVVPLPGSMPVREVFRPGNVIAWRER